MQLIKACKELLIRSSFYGFFLLGLRKELVDDDKVTKTAAVGASDLNFTLYVNKTFWNQLTDLEQLAVLTHEILHLCNFHLTDSFRAENHYLMNIAMDCSINQYISNLPKGHVNLKNISKLIGKQLEPNKGAWYYYDQLQEFIKDNDNKLAFEAELNNCKDIDDHNLWPKDMSEAQKKLYENKIKSSLKEAEEVVRKQAGTIPGEISEILKNIKEKPPIFNWKQYFRRLVGNSISSDVILTRMRPNKRFEENKGIKYKLKPNILVGVDTSGSINDKDLQDFFSEINHIYRSGVSVTVAECDTKIQNIFEYRGNQNIQISGRGGTQLISVIDYYKEHKQFSSCILFTDGYCETQMPNCRNLIWVITSNGNKSQKFSPGNVILIP